MRRKDREVLDLQDIRLILDTCKVCRIGIQDDDGIYVVPLNFGYVCSETGRLELYFHSAPVGRKIDLLKAHPNVGFELDCNHELIVADMPCKYGYRFASIIGTGTVDFLENPAEKMAALQVLMKHQSGKEFAFDATMVQSVSVLRLMVSQYSCKQRA